VGPRRNTRQHKDNTMRQPTLVECFWQPQSSMPVPRRSRAPRHRCCAAAASSSLLHAALPKCHWCTGCAAMMDATFNPGKSQLEELHPGNFTSVSLGSGHNIVWRDISFADSGCIPTCNDTVSMHNPACDLPEPDSWCYAGRNMDLLKCFQPDEKSGLVYATLVAATIVYFPRLDWPH